MNKTTDDSKTVFFRVMHLPRLVLLFAGLLVVAACNSSSGGGSPAPVSASQALCNAILAAFKPDANTTVLMTKAFNAGDELTLTSPPPGTGPTAAADVCMVKLNVGPGSPGTAGAPSTSPGIGIEVWLPTKAAWEAAGQRIHNLGGGGWAGGNQGSTTVIGSTSAAARAGLGEVSGTTDTGHSIGGTGAFAMNEDGSINTALWTDFADRSLNQLAWQTKALTIAAYGEPQKLAYWEGCSTGGRQGYKMAQEHPDFYDGYLVGAPAFNWTKFITNELYPQIVYQQDLGAPLTQAQLDFVSGKAVAACNTVGAGSLPYILDPTACNYDPTTDASVLTTGTCVGGAAAGCVTPTEAAAFNKLWYGQTSDGSVPNPATDSGLGPMLATGNNQLWFGLTRGTNFSVCFAPGSCFGLGASTGAPFSIASDMVALEEQDPTLATVVPPFVNATGNGADGWQALTYANMATAYADGVNLQSFFSDINTDNPDLTGARDHGAKIISYHGWNDFLIAPQGSTNYFTRAAAMVGGNTELQKFNRLFMIPGMSHCGGIGTLSPTGGPLADANSVPLPATGQFFDLLVDWVENGNAPSSVVLNSADMSTSQLVCSYPKKPTYSGTGAVNDAANYSCQ
jgi:hypothetical protein